MLVIGTRASPLALWQAENVRTQLYHSQSYNNDIILKKIIATGDKILDRYLADIGGKGLFTKELDHALLCDDIDMAVHSLKDVETFLPDGLKIAAITKRDSPWDVLINASSIAAIPYRATVGTASVRRQAQILAKRPDITVTLLRGNIQNRLEKIYRGDVDVGILAHAGLTRMKLFDKKNMSIMSCDDMVPSAGQGALAVIIKKDRNDLEKICATLHDKETANAVLCERALLECLDGSCRTPIGAYCDIINGSYHLTGMLACQDGQKIAIKKVIGNNTDIAKRLAQDLKNDIKI